MPSASRTVQAIADRLTITTDYSDHAVVETIDVSSGRLLSRKIDRADAPLPAVAPAALPATPAALPAGHGHADASATTAAAPSAAERCQNSGSYEEFSPGVIRPWRLSEPFRFNPSGAPSNMVGDWRGQISEGKRVWESTRNACSFPDIVIWDMPVGFDSSAAAVANCTESDEENVIGFVNMGGWSSEGLILARTCVWWNDYIYESDMAFNVHPDARWANGAYANYWDLQSVAAHEFGHALGLGHVETSASRETARAVMHTVVYTGDTRNRSLSRGDIDGATALYPRLFGWEIVSSRIDNPAGAGVRMEPGRTYTATVDVQNRGYRPWRVGDSNGVVLSTYPLGRCSAYAGADWRSCSEPSLIDVDASNAGGGPENNESIIAQGEVARYTFQVSAGWDKEGRASFEGFRVRGLPVLDPGDVSLLVDVGTYKAVVTGQSGPGLVAQNVVIGGTPAYASVAVRNEGTAPWILGDGRVRLVTHNPGRCSRFKGGDWQSCSVASMVDTPESVVLPGEVATFDFPFATPLRLGTTPVYVYEAFDVEVVGRPVPRLGVRPAFRFEYY